jgi:lauroyl/myristoyl acyltransferase
MALESPEELLLRISACIFELLTYPQLLQVSRLINVGNNAANIQPERLETLSHSQLLELTKRRAAAEYLAGFARFCEHKLNGRVFVEQVGLLYKSEPGKQTAELARRIFVNEFKNGCLELFLIAFGLGTLSKMVQCRDASVLSNLYSQKSPAILAFWHIGPQFMIGPAMMTLNIPVLIVMKDTPAEIPLAKLQESAGPNLEYLVLSNSPTSSAFALKRCVEHLQKGGIVAMAADGRQGNKQLQVPFLNRLIPVGPGVAVLARLTGASVIPIVWNWIPDSWQIDFQIHRPLSLPKVLNKDANAFDLAVMTEIARWFERHTLSHTDQIRIDRMPLLLQMPIITK